MQNFITFGQKFLIVNVCIFTQLRNSKKIPHSHFGQNGQVRKYIVKSKGLLHFF